MGLIKLALIGGAGYYAVKKLNENKQGNQQRGCNGQCQHPQQQQSPYNVQGRDVSEHFNIPSQPDEKQRYHDYEPDYSQKRQAEVSQRQLPSYPEEQQQRSYHNEKQEYQKNF